MNRPLIALGIALIIAGVIWPLLGKLHFGRLPGDLTVKRGDFAFYFPLTTCLIISIVVSLLFWVMRK